MVRIQRKILGLPAALERLRRGGLAGETEVSPREDYGNPPFLLQDFHKLVLITYIRISYIITSHNKYFMRFFCLDAKSKEGHPVLGGTRVKHD